MISRIWHGYTTRANAAAYENLLKDEIFVGISNRHMRGYHGIHLLRRDIADGVEFITVHFVGNERAQLHVARRAVDALLFGEGWT